MEGLRFKHLVILGAGSTIATIPNGDKYGRRAYTLANLLSDPCMSLFVDKVKDKYDVTDVEKLCNELYLKDKSLYKEFESLVRDKYAQLELPKEFTILDRLVMSLTENDAIISFNWDDLLVQAYNRVQRHIPKEQLPQIAFPHGNAQACYNETSYGSKRNKSNFGMIDSPLNMPVDETYYKDNIFIKSQWQLLDHYIRYSQMITFFGYSAPISDRQDVQRMENLIDKNLIVDKIEIIDKDIESAKKVENNLKRFIPQSNGSYLCASFWHSSIAKFPRHTLDVLENWNFTPDEPIKEESFEEFWIKIKHK